MESKNWEARIKEVNFPVNIAPEELKTIIINAVQNSPNASAQELAETITTAALGKSTLQPADAEQLMKSGKALLESRDIARALAKRAAMAVG